MQANLQSSDFSASALYHVFSWLSIEDLAQTSLVCQLWKETSRAPHLWQSIVEEKMPHIPKPEQTPYWQHYAQNFNALKFHSLSILNGVTFGAWGTTIFVWKRTFGRGDNYSCMRVTAPHSGAITCFVLRQFGNKELLITGSVDKTLKIFKICPLLQGCKLLQTLAGHSSGVAMLAGIGSTILSVSTEGEGCLWQYDTQKRQYTSIRTSIPLHKKGIKLLKSAPQFSQFITVGDSNRIKFWATKEEEFQRVGRIKTKKETITAIACCHSKPILIVGTKSGNALFYERKISGTYQLAAKVRMHLQEITAMEILGTDKFLLTAGKDRKILVWNHPSQLEGMKDVRSIHAPGKGEIRTLCGSLSIRNQDLSRLLYPQENHLCILSFKPGQVKKSTVTATEPHIPGLIETRTCNLHNVPLFTRKFK